MENYEDIPMIQQPKNLKIQLEQAKDQARINILFS